MKYDTIKQIKEWRIKHGVSQRQLAAKAGFSRNTYASWENNRRKASHKVIWRLQNTIFAWGENDYTLSPAQPVRVSTPTAAEPKPKKSLLWCAASYTDRVVKFLLKKLRIIK